MQEVKLHLQMILEQSTLSFDNATFISYTAKPAQFMVQSQGSVLHHFWISTGLHHIPVNVIS